MASKKTNSKTNIHLDQNSHLPAFFSRDRLIPKSDEELTALGAELVKWAEQDSVLRLSDFFTAKYINRDRFYAWAAKHEMFGLAVKLATEMITSRRERGALTGKLNAMVVMSTMGMYDKDYRKFLKWKASLQKEQTNSNETRIVVLDRMPSSDMVPERKEATLKLKDGDEDRD